jgi:hypothetical protein
VPNTTPSSSSWAVHLIPLKSQHSNSWTLSFPARNKTIIDNKPYLTLPLASLLLVVKTNSSAV